ncbi:[acyl-carrier-protein] S-malonyltransferase [bacterium]|nr:[acyl-carrier-protein] S-malonyltransferase [bacterium]|tara:strand:- start:4915 stop:5784 length:870 start_codon:yes stop_codon:yes gene_type:complete
MTCYVFPGQGSQKVGMGETLFNEFSNETKQANEILGYDIQELCLTDPKNQLNQTQFTQPALFVVSALSYLAYQKENPTHPAYLAGHSLGEYNALFAAKVIDFETGIKLVQKRGELMSEASGGAMAAIIGMSATNIAKTLASNNLTGIDIANFNEPNQTVISGQENDIKKAQKIFEEAGVRRYIPLAVSGAFHSRYMEPSKKAFETYLESYIFSEPTIPVIANVTANPYTQTDIKTLLAKQITHSVKWVDSIAYILNKQESDLIEIGPGKVLTGLINKIKKGIETNAVTH